MVQLEVEWRRIPLYLHRRAELFSLTIIIATGEQHVRQIPIAVDRVRILTQRVRANQVDGTTTRRNHSGIVPAGSIAEEAITAATAEVIARALPEALHLRVQVRAVVRGVVIKGPVTCTCRQTDYLLI
jgi:hypothetical protein